MMSYFFGGRILKTNDDIIIARKLKLVLTNPILIILSELYFRNFEVSSVINKAIPIHPNTTLSDTGKNTNSGV